MAANSLPRLLLAVPTMGGTMKSATAVSLVKLTRTLAGQGYDVQIHNIDAADIVVARDLYANMLLHDGKWDALLFVDSDMQFDPALVLRMLKLGGEVVGAAYVKRSLDLHRFATALKPHGDVERAVAQTATFNVRLLGVRNGDPRPKRKDGFLTMAGVGMGCVLIARTALVAMVDAGVVRVRGGIKLAQDRPCWSFFETIAPDGVPLTEDYSFCHRWTRQMGRDLWVNVDEPVGHVGTFTFAARYAALLDSEAAVPPAPDSR